MQPSHGLLQSPACTYRSWSVSCAVGMLWHCPMYGNIGQKPRAVHMRGQGICQGRKVQGLGAGMGQGKVGLWYVGHLKLLAD